MRVAPTSFRWNPRWFAIAALTLFAGLGLALEPGDPVDAVIEELGPPPNYFKMNDRAVYYYPRGRVELERDIVTELDLISEEEALTQQRRLEEERAQREERAAAERTERLQNGLALRSRMLSDPHFLAAPADERATFWRNFAVRYPDIPIGAEYQQALSDLAWEQSQARISSEPREDEADRIERLEERVFEARIGALAAEELAARARERAAEAELTVALSRMDRTADRERLASLEEDVLRNAGYAVPYPVFDAVVYSGRPGPYGRPPSPSAESPSEEVWGRYSISRRLPPQGTPAFGGRSTSR